MALKKPSDFFGNNKKTPLDEVKESYESARPEKIEQVSEAFDAFKSNLNHLQSLSDFTSTFDSFKSNLEKVESVSSEVSGIKEEIKSLIKKEDLDSAMMAQLLFVEESISKIESKVSSINGKTVDKIKEDFVNLSNSVESFLDIDVPKYKKLISESEVRFDDRLGVFKGQVEKNLDSIKEDVSKTELKTEETIKNAIDSYKETIESLNAKVKVFAETEIPKYNNLLIETKLKSEQEVKELEEEVLAKVNSLSEKVDFVSGDVTEKTAEKIQELQTVIDEYKEEIDSISKTYNNLYKDFKKREISDNEKLEGYSNKIEKYNKRFSFLEETVQEDLRDIQEVLIQSNETYHASLKTEVGKFRNKISEQMEGLQMDLVVNEKHIKKQNESIENIQEELKVVLDKLQLDVLEKKNAQLVERINHVEEVFSKINEKTLLTEDNPTLPGDPSTNNSDDPLTPLDQKFVTLDQLQNHYRTFINRIQQQIATIGGGGETRLEFLDDVDRDTAKVNGKFLKYDSSSGKWVGANASGGAGSQTLDETLGLGNTSSTGMSVGLVTTTELHVGVDTGFFTEDLVVNGDARVTGILTIGTGSITLNPSEKKISGIDEIEIGSGTTAITIKKSETGEIQFTDESGEEKSVGIGTTVSINTSGIVTAAGGFVGNLTGTATGLSGTPDITIGNITGVAATFTGVLTYEDVTNIDSLGLGTFRNGLIVQGTGTTSTTLNVSGVSTFTGSINLPDSSGDTVGRALFGDSDDLRIYHDGNNSIIQEVGTGDLRLAGNIVKINNHNNTATMVKATEGGSVELNHNGSKKFETTGFGATVTGDLKVSGDARVVGVLTVGASSLTLDGDNNVVNVGTALTLGHTQGIQFHTQNLHSAGFEVNNINASGIITASSFVGSVTGTASNASGATGDFSISDKIVHTGDTNTAIRFPAADTVTVETSGSEALRVDSSGRLLLGTTTEGAALADNFTVADSGDCGISIRSGTTNYGSIYFSDATSGADEYRGQIEYNHNTDILRLYSGGTAVLRIDPGKLDVIGHTETDTLEVTGIATASQLAVSGLSTSKDLLVTGITSATNVIEIKSNDSTPGRIDLYCETNNAHYARLQAPEHGDFGGNITVKLPASTGTLLLSDGSGASLTSLNASNLGSGTIPDARFPATLPAISGQNLTGIVTGITAGSNITVLESPSGNFIITATGGGGGDTVSINASAGDILSASSGEISADDAGSDKLVFWDDSESKLTYLTAGSGLSISGTTITASGGGGSSGVEIENNGTSVGTGITAINFSTNVTATASGGIATVTASGGGGGGSDGPSSVMMGMIF